MSRLLYVEDDEDLSGLLVSWLKLESYEVETVALGREALSRLETGKYDLLLIDWNLPDISGLEVSETYRARHGTIPIILLTGLSDDDIQSARKLCKSDTVDRIFQKPFDLETLSSCIKQLTSRGIPEVFLSEG